MWKDLESNNMGSKTDLIVTKDSQKVFSKRKFEPILTKLYSLLKELSELNTHEEWSGKNFEFSDESLYAKKVTLKLVQ